MLYMFTKSTVKMGYSNPEEYSFFDGPQLKIKLIDYIEGKICYYNDYVYCEMWMDGSHKLIVINRYTLQKICISDWMRMSEGEVGELTELYKLVKKMAKHNIKKSKKGNKMPQ